MTFALRLVISNLFIILWVSIGSSFAAGELYARAIAPTPVLNTPDFPAVFGGSDGKTLQKDRCGLIRAVEFVAYPGTVFTVLEELRMPGGKVFRVTTRDYPYPSAKGYFIDSLGVVTQRIKPAERSRTLPPEEEIVATMESRVGTGYVWGGDLVSGAPQLLDRYGFPGGSRSERRTWQLAGLDCSGLLYEATGGHTPRNTSALVGYGIGVPVAGRSGAAIAKILEPLDLIVWPGHLLIVLDSERVIESRLVCGQPDEGVRIRPIVDALRDVMKSRRPADSISGGKEFVVRRWYPRESTD